MMFCGTAVRHMQFELEEEMEAGEAVGDIGEE
jgi:hypothetical protein